jgi:hypothetical protein
MKSLNKTRNVQIKYPRDTPRISRKRLWIDRSEWRQDPQAVLENSQGLVDTAMVGGRRGLSESPYEDFPDMTNRAARVGIRKV